MACNGDCKSCTNGFDKKTPSFGQIGLDGINKAITSFQYNPEIHSRPNVVFLGVTARCNLKCKYCFVKQHNTDMSLETARNAVNIAVENAKAHDEKASVVFFGGEPLLMYDEIMVPIIEEYHEVADFTFTTNATLLDEDKVDFLRKYEVVPLISLDGVKEVQDSQRPGWGFSSFDSVLNNIPYILFRFPDVTMRATVSKEFIPKIYESFEMGKELGFKHFSFCIDAFDEWDEEDARNYMIQMNKVGEDIYRNALNEEIYTESTLNASYFDCETVIYGNGKFNNEVMKCGMGSVSMSVTPDGLIVPCQEKISNPTWVIGDVNNGGIDPEKHCEFLIWYLNEMDKIKCPNNCGNAVKEFCMARQCSSRLEDINFNITSSMCAQTKILFNIGNRLWHLTHDSILPGVRAAFEIQEKGEGQC